VGEGSAVRGGEQAEEVGGESVGSEAKARSLVMGPLRASARRAPVLFCSSVPVQVRARVQQQAHRQRSHVKRAMAGRGRRCAGNGRARCWGRTAGGSSETATEQLWQSGGQQRAGIDDLGGRGGRGRRGQKGQKGRRADGRRPVVSHQWSGRGLSVGSERSGLSDSGALN